MDGSIPVNQYFQPLSSPIAVPGLGTPAWKFGVEQGFQGRNVKQSNAKFYNLTALQTDIENLTATLGTLINTTMLSDAGTIIDPTGLVSTTNFLNDEIVSAGGTTTSASFVDVPGSTMNNFVLSRNTRALVNILVSGYNVLADSGFSMQIRAYDSVDGELISFYLRGYWFLNNIDFIGQTWTTTTTQDLSSVAVLADLSAGTHSLKMQFMVNSSGTAKLPTAVMSYIMLGA